MPAGDVLNRHGTDASCDIPDPPKPTKPAGDALTRFCASATAAGLAESLTLPIDITKVRLQTSAVASGQLAIGREIVATEGVGALWKGVVPALFRQCSYTGLSLVLYEPVRNYIAGDVPAAELPFWKRVLAGGTAGGLSIFAVNPTDVVKARLQNSPESLPVVGTLKQVWARSGVSGLWAGWSPNVARCFVGNAAELGCYDQFKMMLSEHGPAACTEGSAWTHLGASTGAGFVSSVASNPVDVLKTRLQASAGLSDEGLVALAMRIPREEGFGAFYKGFWPLFQRKVTWTVIFFMAYEQLRAAASL